MGPFLVFVFTTHSARGGWDDLVAFFGTKQEADKFIERYPAEGMYKKYQIVDSSTGQCESGYVNFNKIGETK